jgi:hypothetical protein
MVKTLNSISFPGASDGAEVKKLRHGDVKNMTKILKCHKPLSHSQNALEVVIIQNIVKSKLLKFHRMIN